VDLALGGFATFSNFFLGMLIAMIINKKGLKLKKLWRTLLGRRHCGSAIHLISCLMSKMLDDRWRFQRLI
jgi:ABC-type sugar transport system permease subunit